MKDEFVMVGDGISEGRELQGKCLGRIVEQQTVAHIKRAEQCRGEPVLYYKPLSGAEAKPTGECYSVFFVPMPGHQPLFAHVDPAEVERLRGELSQLRDEDLKWQGLREQEREIDTLRAQLAERDALLHKLAADPGGSIRHYINSIDAALSASAEPSAPVERDERAEFDAWFKDHTKDWPFPSESIKSIARDNDWLVWQGRAALERKP